ncbi:MAG: hypothetical protein JSU88_09895 [Nitrospinaceae bacterium]|nr:MAG: hypothetical protein JSU88_09895 [Nitrospinaceae bacterium]
MTELVFGEGNFTQPGVNPRLTVGDIQSRLKDALGFREAVLLEEPQASID